MVLTRNFVETCPWRVGWDFPRGFHSESDFTRSESYGLPGNGDQWSFALLLLYPSDPETTGRRHWNWWVFMV